MIFIISILLLIFHYIFFVVFRRHTFTMTIIYLFLNTSLFIIYDIAIIFRLDIT